MLRFKADGKLILGICNGFQVLMKSPVLLDPDPAKVPAATLTTTTAAAMRIAGCGWKCMGEMRLFHGHRVDVPAGRPCRREVRRPRRRSIASLDAAGQLVLRYVHADNPNGAMADVAGVCDPTGRVLGLMPHPERHIDPTQHPRWTRGEAGPVGDGFQVFVNAVRYFA